MRAHLGSPGTLECHSLWLIILSPNLPSHPSGHKSPHPHHRARPQGAGPIPFPLLGPEAGLRTEELVSWEESRRPARPQRGHRSGEDPVGTARDPNPRGSRGSQAQTAKWA